MANKKEKEVSNKDLKWLIVVAATLAMLKYTVFASMPLWVVIVPLVPVFVFIVAFVSLALSFFVLYIERKPIKVTKNPKNGTRVERVIRRKAGFDFGYEIISEK